MVSFGQSTLPLGDPHTGASTVPTSPGVASTRLSALLGGRPAPGPLRADSHLIIMITTGHGSHSLDFQRYSCRPGTLFWGRPGQVHQFGNQPGLDATVLVFNTGALSGLPELAALRHLIDDPLGPTCWHPSGEDGEAIMAEIAQLAADCERYRQQSPSGDVPPRQRSRQAQPQGELTTTLLRHQLAVLLVRIAGLAPAPPLAGAASDVLLKLRGELEREVVHRRVEDYAERLDCSVRTLTRACLAITGRSAKQLVDERVALEAKRILATTDLPVAEVGRHLGFEEPTNFGRFFAREAGQSPGAFRAAVATASAQPQLAGTSTVPAQRSALPGYLEPLASRRALGS